MRLFLAIELPQDVKQWLVDHRYRKEWFGFGEGLRLTRLETLHVTLNFLGEVSAERLAEIRAALAGVPLPGPLDLKVDGFMFFPPRGPIRTFVARVGGAVEPLRDLYFRIAGALEPLGFPREARPFTPHVTLARADQRLKLPGVVRQLVEESPPPAGPAFSVNGFTLFQSHLRPAGPEYVPLARFGP
jgi:2'-5' RNA ligase